MLRAEAQIRSTSLLTVVNVDRITWRFLKHWHFSDALNSILCPLRDGPVLYGIHPCWGTMGSGQAVQEQEYVTFVLSSRCGLRTTFI